METGMIALSAILIIIVAMPFITMVKSENKSKTSLRKGLNLFIEEHHATASKTTTHTNFMLAVDVKQNRLYFFKRNGLSSQGKIIDLKNYDSCTIEKVMSSGSNDKNIEKVSLLFHSRNSNKTDFLELYNEEHTLQLSGEINIAQDWCDYLFRNQVMLAGASPMITTDKLLDFSRISMF